MTNNLKTSWIPLAVAVLSSSLTVTRGTAQHHPVIGPAGPNQIAREAPACAACQGRCQYCVDGQCIPRHQTFGFYETHWRRWPIETPEIVSIKRRTQADPHLGPAAEVPTPHLEADPNPEFPHLRKKRAAAGTIVPTGPMTPLPAGNQLPPGNQPPPGNSPDPFSDDLSQLPPSTLPNPGMRQTGSATRLPVVRAEFTQNIREAKSSAAPARPLNIPSPLRGGRATNFVGSTGNVMPNGGNPLRLAPPATVSPLPSHLPPKPCLRTPTSPATMSNPLRTR
jgi:hypothetical protein